MPTGKIGVYTRFFEFANFRLPLSTFLVDVLRYYRIHISQLSVIAATKVSHFEILCRVHDCEPTVGLFRCFYVNFKKNGWMSFSKRPGNDVVCYTKPIDSLKGWNDRFFWVDAFACPTSFPWHTGKSVSKDPFPSRYYTLDENTYPEFLDENGEEMDLFSFIRTADPTKVGIGERQRGEDEPKLLDTTIGRVVLLLSVAPARAESELEASVDKLFDEGGSGTQVDQGDSVGGRGEEGIELQLVTEATYVVTEDVVSLQPKHHKKRKIVIADHGTIGGDSVGGKSISAIQRLFAGAVQNAKTFGPASRFVISSDSSRHSSANFAKAEVDSLIKSSAPIMTTTTTMTATVDATTILKETLAKPSLFAAGSSSAGDTEPTPGGFFDLIGNEFLSVTNGSRLDDNWDCREMVDEFAPPRFFTSVRGMEHDQLFTEFNVGVARQMTLSAEVRMWAEYNIKEKRRLKYVVDDQAEVLKVKEKEMEDLRAHLLLKEAKAAKAIRLGAEASKFEVAERVADLAASVKVREQEAANLDVMVTSVKSQKDCLVDQVHQ
ncbi:hypothetical protein Tco_1463169, partial [Tanacetum coccineum]